MFNKCLPTAGGRAPHQQHSPTKSHGYGGYGQHHTHRSVTHGGHEFSRDRHRDDPDNLARIKLSVPKFTGQEGPISYIEWEEQCDQIFREYIIFLIISE